MHICLYFFFSAGRFYVKKCKSKKMRERNSRRAFIVIVNKDKIFVRAAVYNKIAFIEKYITTVLLILYAVAEQM